MEGDAIRLYLALQPRDTTDSILARQIVALNIVSMSCFSRAEQSDARARDINLRFGIKGNAALVELIKFYEDRRRQDSSNVTVGNVNVEAGGQAIVGNVKVGEATDASRSRPKKAMSEKLPWLSRWAAPINATLLRCSQAPAAGLGRGRVLAAAHLR